jgi:hypothetical protein
MDDRKEKSYKIVKSIKLLESVLRTSPDAAQRSRVKKELENLRKMLKEMYPNANLSDLEEAVFSDVMAVKHDASSEAKVFDHMKEVGLLSISPFKDDHEVNVAISILRYFEEQLWGVIADQHTKLDFTNAGNRDSLYRKMDQCNRSIKLFAQTIADMEKPKSTDYGSQLNLMRMKQGRVFLIEICDFVKDARSFITNLVEDAEQGGNMVLNAGEKIVYADYEKYRTFEGQNVMDALKFIMNFVNEAFEVINVTSVSRMDGRAK